MSDTALTVLNGSAKEMFSARHSYNDPAVSEASGRYLLYNAGSTGYRVETSSGTEISGTSDSSITTGVICDSGKFALAVQPSDYASELRVYNKNGSLQYKYSFADSYITAVALNCLLYTSHAIGMRGKQVEKNQKSHPLKFLT